MLSLQSQNIETELKEIEEEKAKKEEEYQKLAKMFALR